MALLDKIRSATSQLTPFFIYLLFTCTLGTLLFGFHLVSIGIAKSVVEIDHVLG